MGMRLSPELTAKVLALAGKAPPPLAEGISEKDFQDAVKALAKRNGWRVHHHTISLKSAAGWPDLTMVRGGRLIFAELKVGGNKPTADQLNWICDLGQVAGVVACVWTPALWPEIEVLLA